MENSFIQIDSFCVKIGNRSKKTLKAVLKKFAFWILLFWCPADLQRINLVDVLLLFLTKIEHSSIPVTNCILFSKESGWIPLGSTPKSSEANRKTGQCFLVNIYCEQVWWSISGLLTPRSITAGRVRGIHRLVSFFYPHKTIYMDSQSKETSYCGLSSNPSLKCYILLSSFLNIVHFGKHQAL